MKKTQPSRKSEATIQEKELAAAKGADYQIWTRDGETDPNPDPGNPGGGG